MSISGINRLSRRGLLAGIAAASALAASASPGKETVSESPRLLELAEGLPAIANEHQDADATKRAIYRAAMKIWPKVPEEIAVYSTSTVFSCHDHARDVGGAGFGQDGESGKYKCVISAKTLQCRVEGYKRELTRKVVANSEKRTKDVRAQLKDSRAKLRLAKAYEKECARIKADSGYEPSPDAWNTARDALHAHVDAIMREPAKTMTGVVIKAQALECWGKVDCFYQAFNVEARHWADEMAKAVIQQGAGGVA